MVLEGSVMAIEHGREERPMPVKNEMRITQQGKTRMYISHGQSLLTEKGADSITIKAIGRAINKAVTTAEILKRRVEGLHQIADISSTSVVDTQQQHRQQQQPQEDGQRDHGQKDHGQKDHVQKEEDGQFKKAMRRASVIIITLSFSPLDTSHIGYQPPLPPEEINPGNGGRGFSRGRPGERGCIPGRGRGRGGRRIPGRSFRPRPPGAIGLSWTGGPVLGSQMPYLGVQPPQATVSNVQPSPYPLGFGQGIVQGYGQMQGVMPGRGQPLMPPPQGVRYGLGSPGDSGFQPVTNNSVLPVQAYPQMYGNAGYTAVGIYSVAPAGYTPHIPHPGVYGGAPLQASASPQWPIREVQGGERGGIFGRGRWGRGGRNGMWRGGGFQDVNEYPQPQGQAAPFTPDGIVR